MARKSDTEKYLAKLAALIKERKPYKNSSETGNFRRNGIGKGYVPDITIRDYYWFLTCTDETFLSNTADYHRLQQLALEHLQLYFTDELTAFRTDMATNFKGIAETFSRIVSNNPPLEYMKLLKSVQSLATEFANDLDSYLNPSFENKTSLQTIASSFITLSPMLSTTDNDILNSIKKLRSKLSNQDLVLLKEPPVNPDTIKADEARRADYISAYQKWISIKYALSKKLNEEFVLLLGYIPSSVLEKAPLLAKISALRTTLYHELYNSLPFEIREAIMTSPSTNTGITPDYIYCHLVEIITAYTIDKEINPKSDSLTKLEQQTLCDFISRIKTIAHLSTIKEKGLIANTPLEIIESTLGIKDYELAVALGISPGAISKKKHNNQLDFVIKMVYFRNFYDEYFNGKTTIPFYGKSSLAPYESNFQISAYNPAGRPVEDTATSRPYTLAILSATLTKQRLLNGFKQYYEWQQRIEGKPNINDFKLLINHIIFLENNLAYLDEDDFSAIQCLLRPHKTKTNQN